MYIETAEINNIKAIGKLKLTFKNPAGWHVLIGDNGAGKSTILKSISLALVGPEQILGLRENWNDWLNNKSDKGNITLYLDTDNTYDRLSGKGSNLKNWYVKNVISFSRKLTQVNLSSNINPPKGQINPLRFNWGDGYGWFSAAYGPFRRFGREINTDSKIFYSQPKLGAHLSVFGENFALSESIEWLINLQYQYLEKKGTRNTIDQIKKLVNSPDFLPHNTRLEKISSEGILFKDGNDVLISVTQMSDGFRSILSLTFELIRQLVRVYGDEATFAEISKGNMIVDVPGVVIIDEVDAHLHPSWQTRIGEWFIKYFPKIQFIVSSHSPLICRACERGSIWRLVAPGNTENKSGEVKGADRDKLISGNILDAYGTEIFGTSTVRSSKSDEKLEKLGRLNMLKALGKITPQQSKERSKLQKIMSTDDPTGI
jgi:predicted ATPase